MGVIKMKGFEKFPILLIFIALFASTLLCYSEGKRQGIVLWDIIRVLFLSGYLDA